MNRKTLSLIGLAVLLALLMVILWGVPLEGQHFKKVLMLGGVALLYFTFFITLGVFISSISKRYQGV